MSRCATTRHTAYHDRPRQVITLHTCRDVSRHLSRHVVSCRYSSGNLVRTLRSMSLIIATRRDLSRHVARRCNPWSPPRRTSWCVVATCVVTICVVATCVVAMSNDASRPAVEEFLTAGQNTPRFVDSCKDTRHFTTRVASSRRSRGHDPENIIHVVNRYMPRHVEYILRCI